MTAEREIARTEPGSRFTEMVERLFGEQLPTSRWSRLWDEGLLPVDISQTDREVIVRASLPGFEKGDVEVQLSEGILSIKAEQTRESEDTGEHYYRKERHYGSLSRRVALPGIVGDAEAEAELKDGVLTVRVPLSERAQPKRVEVKG